MRHSKSICQIDGTTHSAALLRFAVLVGGFLIVFPSRHFESSDLDSVSVFEWRELVASKRLSHPTAAPARQSGLLEFLDDSSALVQRSSG